MDISPLFFYLFAGSAIGFSLLVVAKRNPVASAFSLVMVFLSFAGIYALLEAHLVAALQVLVYAGAVMVLFVFVIMLLNADIPLLRPQRTAVVFRGVAVLVALSGIAVFVVIFKKGTAALPVPGAFSPAAVEAAGGNTRVISELLFSEYILPFELTSVLLLGAIVGAVALAKRHAKRRNTHAS